MCKADGPRVQGEGVSTNRVPLVRELNMQGARSFVFCWPMRRGGCDVNPEILKHGGQQTLPDHLPCSRKVRRRHTLHSLPKSAPFEKTLESLTLLADSMQTGLLPTWHIHCDGTPGTATGSACEQWACIWDFVLHVHRLTPTHGRREMDRNRRNAVWPRACKQLLNCPCP
jgi:hypothetical protein